MLSKGFVRNLGEPVPSSDQGVLKTEETRGEDEGQVVGSTHIVPMKPGNAGGGKGLTVRCTEEGKQCRTQSLQKHCQRN